MREWGQFDMKEGSNKRAFQKVALCQEGSCPIQLLIKPAALAPVCYGNICIFPGAIVPQSEPINLAVEVESTCTTWRLPVAGMLTRTTLRVAVLLSNVMSTWPVLPRSLHAKSALYELLVHATLLTTHFSCEVPENQFW